MPRRQRDVYSKIIGESSEKQLPQSGDTVTTQDQSTVLPPNREDVVTQEGDKGTMQSSTDVIQQDDTTALPQSGTKGKTQKGSTGKTHKITFYPGPGQEDKLNELIVEYWQRHHRMLNQNDILRHLVEQCSITSLETLHMEE